MAIKELADAALWIIQFGAAATSVHTTCKMRASAKPTNPRAIKRRGLSLRPLEWRKDVESATTAVAGHSKRV